MWERRLSEAANDGVVKEELRWRGGLEEEENSIVDVTKRVESREGYGGSER